MKVDKFKESKRVLPDDYPVYAGYIYIADGIIIMSEFNTKVGVFKRLSDVKEVRSCDIVERGLL